MSLDWSALATALSDLKIAVAELAVAKSEIVALQNLTGGSTDAQRLDALETGLAGVKADLAALVQVVDAYAPKAPPPEEPPAE